jgi:fimbrial chaperone protein
MLRRALVLAVLGLCSSASFAAAQARIEVSPVSVDLTIARPIASLRLRNTASTPAAFDARAYAWTQSDGQDQLAPASDLIVAPPAFVIAPGGEQIVRIATLAKTAPQTELAYRLLLSEAPLQNDAAPAGLRLRLQLSLPVFLAPADRGGAPRPRVEYVSAGQQRGVRIENVGAVHLILADAAFGAEKLSLPRYLLAGARVERPAPAAGVLALSYLDPDTQDSLRSDYASAQPIASGR